MKKVYYSKDGTRHEGKEVNINNIYEVKEVTADIRVQTFICEVCREDNRCFIANDNNGNYYIVIENNDVKLVLELKDELKSCSSIHFIDAMMINLCIYTNGDEIMVLDLKDHDPLFDEIFDGEKRDLTWDEFIQEIESISSCTG